MTRITQTKTARTLPPEGTFLASLYQIIFIGTVPREWKGETKLSTKVRLGFELTSEKKVFKEGDAPKPFVVSREFTYSLSEMSSLLPFVQGVMGKSLSEEEKSEFEIEKLIGKQCLVTIVHRETENGKYANIISASPLIKGMAIEAQVNPSFVLNYEEAWSDEKFASLPDFLKEMMEVSTEYKALKLTDKNDSPF